MIITLARIILKVINPLPVNDTKRHITIWYKILHYCSSSKNPFIFLFYFYLFSPSNNVKQIGTILRDPKLFSPVELIFGKSLNGALHWPFLNLEGYTNLIE